MRFGELRRSEKMKKHLPPYLRLLICGLLAFRSFYHASLKEQIHISRFKKDWTQATLDVKADVFRSPKHKGIMKELARLKRNKLISILGTPHTSIGSTNIQYNWGHSDQMLYLHVIYDENDEPIRQEWTSP